MKTSNYHTIAESFGRSLDQDRFDLTRKLLSEDCQYFIGSQLLEGPEAICDTYEQNMIEGRKKLDELVWGDSRVEAKNEKEFIVHFTDYLTHQGVEYTHRCAQVLTMNDDGKICRIQHLDDAIEQEKLDAYYRSVGLKK